MTPLKYLKTKPMNSFVYIIYALVVGLIRVYKWLEFQILKLFSPLCRRIEKFLLKPLGIVVHCPGDPKWTEADSKKLLSECTKYNTLIHLKAHDNIFFPMVANGGTTSGGEAYMDKVWDICDTEEDLTQLHKRLFDNKIFDYYFTWWNSLFDWLELFAFNLQTRQRAFQVGVEHYNLGESNKLKLK